MEGTRLHPGHTHRDKRAKSQTPAVAGAIAVENLTIRFGAAVALEDVTIDVPAGRLVAIAGPPGSGKSTLLKALSCELPWSAGSIVIANLPTRLWPARKWDCVLYSCPARGSGSCDPAACPNAPSDELAGAFRLLGLEHLMQRRPESLSERDRSRVGLARALAASVADSERAVHLWLDDPLLGLDTLHQHRLLHWLQETARTRHTTLLTTTDHAIVRAYADKAILLSRGRVVSQGAAAVALSPAHLSNAFGEADLIRIAALR